MALVAKRHALGHCSTSVTPSVHVLLHPATLGLGKRLHKHGIINSSHHLFVTSPTPHTAWMSSSMVPLKTMSEA